MGELIGSYFVFLTILMWLNLILIFISKSFRKDTIKSLIELDKELEEEKESYKKMFIQLKNYLVKKFTK